MATSSFKSTSKRTPIANPPADDPHRNSSSHRRSRSLSRFSHSLPHGGAPAPEGRFVNTARGLGFPEMVSLDDLAVRFFGSGDGGRSASRNDEADPVEKTSGSQRRGRSASRQSARVSGEGKRSGGKGHGGGGRVNSEINSRQRRSVSVVRYQVSDSESDVDHSQNSNNLATSKSFTSGNGKIHLSDKTTAPNYRQGLRRSLSQRDLKCHDGYSSHSSALTDDEVRDEYFSKNGPEKTIRAVYSTKKAEPPLGDDTNNGLYEAMRKELRNAVEELRIELEQTMVKTTASEEYSGNSDALHAVSNIRRSYATKMGQSEKRKQDLLTEILLEEQRGRTLSEIMKKLLPDSKNTVAEKPSRARKRSNDRSRMSKRLTEEAERYIEDFISNVEDTDISSLDGERSDTSSTLGGTTKTGISQTPTMSKSIPAEMDGVVLPWLQWETSNDASPLSSTTKEPASTPKTNLGDAVQESTAVQDSSNHSLSSHGSWSPGGVDGHSTNVNEVGRRKLVELGLSYPREVLTSKTKSQSDMHEYHERREDEEFLHERWRQQHRIHSGSLLLCNQMVLSYFL